MAGTLCFEEMFSNLIKKLKENDRVVEVSSHFGAHYELEDMFTYLWNLEEAQVCLFPTLSLSKKSDEDSDRLRNEGNKFYQKKVFDKALKLYNLSIMSSPHPEFPVSSNCNKYENNDVCEYERHSSGEKEFRSLALGFANRSAVFYELKQYMRCIDDIELALLYGYPKLLHCKLSERKSKCLIMLGKRDSARQTVEDALRSLDDLKLEESKSKTSRDALHKLLLSCESDDATATTNYNGMLPVSLVDASKEELLFAYQTSEVPVLSGHNPVIPCLSDAVKIAFTEMQGRYLVADREILPGEVLIVEKAYSHILLLDSSLRTHCCVCLKRCLNPLPCPTCAKVIFCSLSCRKEGLSSWHRKECHMLPTLAELDIGKNAILAFRILMQTTFSELKKLIPLYHEEANNLSPEELGFRPESKPIYDSSDYRTIYHLVTNKEQRSVSDLFKRCAMAVTLAWLLKESLSYYVSSSGEAFSPSQEDITLVGCTILTHMMNLPCNAHSITELQVDVSNFQKSCSQEIGAGAFGVLSLTNHSCNPSAARFSYGSTNVLRSIRLISKGDEVTDSYGEHYGLQASAQRKSALQQQYYFECKCQPCKDNWPTYYGLSSKHSLKCPCCNKKINNSGKCPYCKISFTEALAKESGVEDLTRTHKDVESEINQGMKDYETAYESIVLGNNSTENKEKLCKFIRLIDNYVEQPSKTYFEAQETLKHYFDRQGSCVFRKEVPV